jgi:hypothetical protein
MSYIMAHAPGTTAKMWRRAMYGYLAHGVTMINLYEFRPCLASYTGNDCSLTIVVASPSSHPQSPCIVL